MSRKNETIAVTAVFLLFTIIFCLISLVNHCQFRTSALDLGMYNQALYSYAHFKEAIFTLGVDGNEVPFIATHFSFLTILFSPLYYLFGSYTLLIVQIFAILAGGLAVYKYARENFEDNSILPIIILIQFFSIWGIYSALSFDFHENVPGAMFVLWFVYYLEKRKLFQSAIFLLLILLSKEIMSIWALFILLGLMIKNRKKFRKEYIKFEIPAAIFCLLYGIVIMAFVMPSVQNSDNNLQLMRYSQFGDSWKDIVLTFIHKPQLIFSALFLNTTGYHEYDFIKTEFHLMVLVSGGICLFLRPVYLLMLLPVYATKFLSNDYSLWGINYQYSIEFVPIISLAFIDFSGHLKKHKTGIATIIVLTTIMFNLTSMVHRESKWYKPQDTRFYSKSHYDPELNLPEIRKALKLIDSESTLSVSSCLAPRLSFRNKIYHFPIIKDAEYIVLITKYRSPYPLREEEFAMRWEELKNSGEFAPIYDANNLLILKRKTAYPGNQAF
jgi:uncharacterized membrane protein